MDNRYLPTALSLLGRSAAGTWVLRAVDGRSEAVFRDRRQAIHDALYQSKRPIAVLLSDEPVEMEALR